VSAPRVARGGALLPLALRRALRLAGRHAPAEAAAARAALRVALAPLLRAAGDPACWGLSLLTDGGYPCELAFTTRGGGVRYTVEVAPPRQPPHGRLDQARRVVERLGGAVADPGALAGLRRVQAAGGLRYGAWLGVRHHGGETAFKVYAEVPPGGREAALALLEGGLRRPVGVAGRPAEPRMIGWNPATGETEFYFGVRGLRPWEIPALLDPAGLARRGPEVLRLLQAACARPIHPRLPGAEHGFSYALGPGSVSFTFYAFAGALFGDDARARRRLLALFAALDAPAEPYRQISAPVARHRGRWMHHGLFGVTVGPAGPPAAHVGLRPPGGSPHG